MVSESAGAPKIAVLGASGLIGHAIATALADEGFAVVAMARRFTLAQEAALGGGALNADLVGLDVDALARMLSEHAVEIVVNCVGVLQDGPSGKADEVHTAFVRRLVQALSRHTSPSLLVQLSVPGAPQDDPTAFSRTKHDAEELISASGLPFVILRPGFVVAPAAFGGSALIRALAALPLALPAALAARPFAAIDVADIARTVAVVARRWQAGERQWSVSWDVMERQPATVGGVVEAFRRRFGGPSVVLRLPMWLVRSSVVAGDAVAHLGWSPPLRTTALAEMARGVAGDPQPWMDATGIHPLSLAAALRRVPATVQETWFARLYLAKPAIVASLVVFWVLSGLVALTVSFDAATAILTARGFPTGLAPAVTVASSLVDIGVGLLIAFRRSCRIGLVAGIAVSLGYMLGSAIVTPDLWIEPLGALVKTAPAVVLMLVGLALLDRR